MADARDQSLGRLFANVGRLHATRADQYLDQMGLYRGQAILLITLSRHDGMTHSEIAERLQISPAAATKVIKRLEQAQYLRRQPDPRDERVSRLYLCDEGHAALKEIFRSFADLDCMTFAGLNEEELAQFRELLLRVQANLQRGQESDAPRNCVS
jgi:MarR family transcriptional regulator, organic hydroperoxide resistance regulator